jgi:transcriptional regulator with XRE-family HTH domain
MKSQIGERIKEVREKRGLTRSDLAYKAEVTPAAVWNWEENGSRPRPGVLKLVARVLGVSEEELVTGSALSVRHQGQQMSPPEIIEEARRRIAEATGFSLTRIKLKLEIASED